MKKNKTIFITGASGGIGQATVELFSSKGWNVCATMRNENNFDIFDKLTNVTCYKVDVTDISSIKSAVISAIKKYGRIDVLVNNAGFGALGIFEDFTDEEVKKQFETNVFGLMNVTKCFLPYFRKHRKGTIINISSLAGQVGLPLYSLYSSTKWAIEGFSESLQYELKPFNIKLKLIEPGPVKTNFHGSSKLLPNYSKISAYKKYYSAVYKMTLEQINKSETPDIVAEAIYLASITKSKKMRFPVSKNTSIYILLKKILPNSIFYKVVSFAMEKEFKK